MEFTLVLRLMYNSVLWYTMGIVFHTTGSSEFGFAQGSLRFERHPPEMTYPLLHSASKKEFEMSSFSTKRLPVQRTAVAPDGSDVRVLLELGGGSLAHFELPPGETSIAVAHRTVEEIWFFLSGRGEMWRKLDDHEETVPVGPGVCLTIPLATHFQFRSFGYEPLAAIGVTMPPWPGEGEAYQIEGKWAPTVKGG